MQESRLIFWEKKIGRPASYADLWEINPFAPTIIVNSESFIPSFRIKSEVIQEIWSEGAKHLSGCLGTYKQDLHRFHADRLSWESPLVSHFNIYLLQDIPETLLDKAYTKTQKRISQGIGTKESRQVSHMDFLNLTCKYSVNSSSLSLDFYMLHPSLKLELRTISPFKIVSNPLTKILSHDNHIKFRTGILTMDQARRLLCLLPNDEIAITYPTVGIWAAGCSDISQPLSCPLLWSACMRYIETPALNKRLSVDPSSMKFVLIIFTPQVVQFEVAVSPGAQWRVLKSGMVLYRAEGLRDVTVSFMQSLKSPFSCPSARSSATTEPMQTARFASDTPMTLSFDCSTISDFQAEQVSFVNSTSSDRLDKIEEQSKHIKELQSQISYLQVLYTQNVVMNISTMLNQSKVSNSTLEDIQPSKDLLRTPVSRTSTRCQSDVYSTPGDVSMQFDKDMSICIPKINYQSGSDSEELDNII